MGYANLRKLFEDDRVNVVAARVALHEDATGPSDWWRVNAEGDVVVDCLTLQHEVPIAANLGALVGGGGNGVWQIPGLGVEVMVASDNGDFEAELYIVGYFPSGASPQGLAPGKVLVIGSAVEVRTADGTAEPLALKSDVQAVHDALSGHTHGPGSFTTPSAGGGGGPVTGASGAAGSFAAPAGTTILKAE